METYEDPSSFSSIPITQSFPSLASLISPLSGSPVSLIPPTSLHLATRSGASDELVDLDTLFFFPASFVFPNHHHNHPLPLRTDGSARMDHYEKTL